MPNSHPLDFLPIWAVYLVTVLIALTAVELGYRLGRYWQKRFSVEKEDNIGSLVGATLAMLGFLLVFMVGMAENRFESRRQLVVDQANAIGTAYLRAGYLEEPYRTENRQFFREYVEVRLAALDPSQFANALARTEEIHTELWARAEALARAYPESDMVALYIRSLNDVIDIHTKRVMALNARIPFNVWLALYFMGSLTMAMVGYQNGLTGRHLIPLIALILVFSAGMLLMIDLDRPLEGLLQVNQQALIDLLAQMKSSPP